MATVTSGSLPSQLSADELKGQLLRAFQMDGSVGQLRAQLRRQFLLKLRQKEASAPPRVAWGEPGSLTGGSLSSPLSSSSSSSLPAVTVDILRSKKGAPTLKHRALNAAIADYLRAMGYQFALSVFLPESGSEEVAMSSEDVLDALRLREAMEADENANETSVVVEGGGRGADSLLLRVISALRSASSALRTGGGGGGGAPSRVGNGANDTSLVIADKREPTPAEDMAVGCCSLATRGKGAAQFGFLSPLFPSLPPRSTNAPTSLDRPNSLKSTSNT